MYVQYAGTSNGLVCTSGSLVFPSGFFATLSDLCWVNTKTRTIQKHRVRKTNCIVEDIRDTLDTRAELTQISLL